MRPVVLSAEKTARSLGIPTHEAALHDAVVELAEALLPRREIEGSLVVAPELALPYGRPDVIVAVVDTRQWARWRMKGVDPCTAPLPLATALSLARLGGSSSIARLVDPASMQTERSRIRRALATLEKHGWVERESEMFKLRLSPGAAVRSITGIEAKLSNWRKAVRQVQSWENYVDSAWLAFPIPYLPNVPRVQALRRFGLIGVRDGGATIARRPRSRRANGFHQALTEQFLYRRWLAEKRL